MMMMIFVLSDLFLIVFPFLELEQPTAGSDPYFLRMFYPLLKIKFLNYFKTICCHYSFLLSQLGCVSF